MKWIILITVLIIAVTVYAGMESNGQNDERGHLYNILRLKGYSNEFIEEVLNYPRLYNACGQTYLVVGDNYRTIQILEFTDSCTVEIKPLVDIGHKK